jgi:hypothetical protein
VLELGQVYRGPWQQNYWSSDKCLFRHAYPVSYCGQRTGTLSWLTMPLFLCNCMKVSHSPCQQQRLVEAFCVSILHCCIVARNVSFQTKRFVSKRV